MFLKQTNAISSISIGAVLAVALTLNGGVMSVAQEMVRGDRAVSANGAIAVKPTVAVGDRLKITFFESLDIGSRATAGAIDSAAAGPALQTFYQRMDLSGEFNIDQDGSISLPRLGRFVLAGRSVPEIQADLAITFTRVMGRPADVNVTITERQPIYVVGPVKQPGSYKFVSGMMVIQAVALAGGFEHGLVGTSQAIEGIREFERVQKSADQMKRLLARRARFEAQRGGMNSLQAPEQLIAIAGENGADTYLASENALLRVERSQRDLQSTEAVTAVTLAQNELQALRLKLTALETQRGIKAERFAELQKLMTRGITTRNGVVAVRSELAEIETQRHEALVAIVRAEGRVKLAEQAQRRVHADASASLIRAIAQVDSEISELNGALASTELIMTFVEESSSRLTLAKTTSRPTYEIVRQGSDGASIRSATETSVLQPGDVLKIQMVMQQPARNAGNVKETRLEHGRLQLR